MRNKRQNELQEKTLMQNMKKIGFISGIFMLAMVHASHALVITSPQNGASFKEGDTVRIVAEKSSGDPKFAFVYFVVTGGLDKCPERISTHPRYECSFIIPSGSPRSIEIGAVAVTADQPVSSLDISINVSLPSSVILQGLKSFTGNRLFFSKIGQNDQLYIQGSYSDGVERDLEQGQTGTTYVSSNEKIVTVNADGLATSVGPGNAQITVRNGDKKLVVDVVVQPKR